MSDRRIVYMNPRTGMDDVDPASLNAALKWWEQTFADRLSVDGPVMCIQSRLHEADAPGQISSDSGSWPALKL